MNLSDYSIACDAVAKLSGDLTRAQALVPEPLQSFNTLIVPRHFLPLSFGAKSYPLSWGRLYT